MRLFLLLLLISKIFPVFGQDNPVIEFAGTIQTSDLRKHLEILASDAMGGRETGDAGQKMAAAYIAHFFQKTGLEPIVPTPAGPSYLQQFDLIKLKAGEAWIELSGKRYENFRDIVFAGSQIMNSPLKSIPVFAGSGNEQVYEVIDVKGKDVAIYSTGDRQERNEKVGLALRKGAKNIFIVHNTNSASFGSIARSAERELSWRSLVFPDSEYVIPNPYFLVSVDFGAELLGIAAGKIEEIANKIDNGNKKEVNKLKTREIRFFARQEVEIIQTENVLGFIEGSDKKDECIVLTAHYDHIGMSDSLVYNGADDDGSGTVAILEMAEAFAMAKSAGHAPRRSILFMTVTGEEKGLLGSTYYVNNPAWSLSNSVANLNIDMIGRVDDAHKSNPEYVYLIGSDKLSAELHEISERANATYSKLELDYTYNDENDPNRFYYRSDHYNFAKNNIPVIFYFNGTHEDYHKTTDTVDKIEFEILEKRTKLVFYTAWELANRESRIVVDVQPGKQSINNQK